MEKFSALLALCARNSPVPGEFPSQRPVTRSLNVFFDLHLNKLVSKQSWGWWFETTLPLLWCHCNFKSTGNSSVSLLFLVVTREFPPKRANDVESLSVSRRHHVRVTYLLGRVSDFAVHFECLHIYPLIPHSIKIEYLKMHNISHVLHDFIIFVS